MLLYEVLWKPSSVKIQLRLLEDGNYVKEIKRYVSVRVKRRL